MSTEKQKLGWCILELMGHRRMGGFVQEAEIAGSKFLRIDVPEANAYGEEGPFSATQFYSASAVYAITPTTLDIAVGLAQACQPEPVKRWELPRAKTEPAADEDPSVPTAAAWTDDDLDPQF